MNVGQHIQLRYSKTEIDQGVPMTTKTILIIEDDIQIGNLEQRLLETAVYEQGILQMILTLPMI